VALSHDRMERPVALELILARWLRAGSTLAAAIMAAGIAALLAGLPVGGTVITVGIWVLMSTPVIRVVVALLVFLRERDWLFALFCLVVLASLAAGVWLGQLR
jgi:uncharacterized membrane protein